eukprot:g3288.t1
MLFKLSALVCCLGLPGVDANMFDNLLPDFVAPAACKSGCASWADLKKDGNSRNQADVDAKWAAGKAPADALTHCAMPANDPDLYTGWCYCKDEQTSGQWGSCTSPPDIPTQINLQLSSASEVVVSFVTFESMEQQYRPQVQFSTDAAFPAGAKTVEATGVCHHFTQAGSPGKHYALHFVKMEGLDERTEYHYRVRSSASADWTSGGAFTSLYSSGVTRFAVFGDMGLYAYNNMGNLKRDMEDGRMDFIVHLGDHAYNMEDENGDRGDGYLNAFQDVLANMVWMPVLGNHEFYGGADGHADRYLNQTYGIVLGEDGSAQLDQQRRAHNLQSALNAGLTLGTAKGAAASASGNSRYFSQDIGLVHLVALDMNVWFNSYEARYLDAQLQWLEADLAAANEPAQRAKVPWVTINVHHPFYCSSVTMGNGRGAEPLRQLGEMPDGFAGCVGTGAATAEKVRQQLEPLMLKHGVDVFFAGHEHNYDVSWPVAHGQPVQKDYTNPQAPVHIVTGAGGAPALDKFGPPGPYTRLQKSAWGYGQVVVANATAFQYTHVLNADHSVFDKFTITQERHGSFDPPTQPPAQQKISQT